MYKIKSSFLLKVLQLFLVFIVSTTLINCGGGGSGSGTPSTTTTTTTTVKVSGILDASSISVAKPGQSGDAAGMRFAAASINKVVAIGDDLSTITATASGQNISMNLVKGTYYVLVFLNGTTVVGTYKADAATDLDSIPVTETAADLDLGTLTLDTVTGKVTGTVTQSTLFSKLGLDTTTATAIGTMDNEMMRLSSVDVDSNGVLDSAESKTHNFTIRYNFSSGTNGSQPDASFASITNNWSDKSLYSFKGYQFTVNIPSTPALTWANAVLHPPQAINGVTQSLTSYQSASSTSVSMEFFSVGTPNGSNPYTPPPGTYTVTIDASTFTFNNVQSVTVDSALNNEYAPVVKLTVGTDGKVSKFEWVFWKKSGGTWTQVSDSEIQAVIGNMDFQLLSAGNNEVARGDVLTIAATGSQSPPTQNIVPTAFHTSYTTKSGYNYAMDWYF